MIMHAIEATSGKKMSSRKNLLLLPSVDDQGNNDCDAPLSCEDDHDDGNNNNKKPKRL